jgi:hypothetical protein
VVRIRIVLTDVPLLQERQCIHVRPPCVVVEDVCIALVIDVWSGEELDRSSNDSGDEENEEDEGEEHHGAREEFPLRNVDDFDDDEDYSQCADRDAVGHYPVVFVSTVLC